MPLLSQPHLGLQFLHFSRLHYVLVPLLIKLPLEVCALLDLGAELGRGLFLMEGLLAPKSLLQPLDLFVGHLKLLLKITHLLPRPFQLDCGALLYLEALDLVIQEVYLSTVLFYVRL